MPKSKSKRKKTGGFIARQRDARIVRTGRFFERGESIPPANIDVIHESLDVALALLKDARLLDQETLARILMGNFRVIPDGDLKYVLGEHYDQVMAWERKEEKKDGQ